MVDSYFRLISIESISGYFFGFLNVQFWIFLIQVALYEREYVIMYLCVCICVGVLCGCVYVFKNMHICTYFHVYMHTHNQTYYMYICESIIFIIWEAYKFRNVLCVCTYQTSRLFLGYLTRNLGFPSTLKLDKWSWTQTHMHAYLLVYYSQSSRIRVGVGNHITEYGGWYLNSHRSTCPFEYTGCMSGSLSSVVIRRRIGNIENSA